MNLTRHDEYFLNVAFETAKLSKDPKHKVGAVITIDKAIVSTGYNGYVRGSDDSEELYKSSEYKERNMVHAEENAIFNASLQGKSILGSTIYITHLSCIWCVNSLIQTGVKEVFAVQGANSTSDKWHFEEAQKKFTKYHGGTFNIVDFKDEKFNLIKKIKI